MAAASQALLLAMGGGYTTWNPSDKDAGVTLSNGNLTAATSTADDGVRSISGKDAATANFYVEFTQTSGTNKTVFGIGTIGASLDFPGADANGYGYFSSNGNKFNSGSGSAYGSSFTDGDVIGMLLKNGKLYFRKNGTWQNSGDPAAETGFAFSGISGTFYLLYGTASAGATNITLNAGATAFAAAAPSGATGWTA